jgi:hypothetical protein
MASDPTDRLAARQARKNAQVCDAWDRFSPHRRRVTQLLVPESPPEGLRLCVLGAGNCNDLDLRELSTAFEEVHLVDIDGTAMRDAVARQGHADDPKFIVHAGADLSGLSPFFDRDRSAQNLDIAAGQAASVRDSPVAAGCEVVASVCLLTQLLELATEYPGETHSRYLEFVRAIRLGHLRMLIQQVARGGTGVLVTDLVSTDSDPGLASVPDEHLDERVRSLIEQRNFFTGVNPAVLHALFTTDPEISVMVTDVEMISPWRWDLGPRVYAVYGIRFRKR